jgi:hypothetical protein
MTWVAIAAVSGKEGPVPLKLLQPTTEILLVGCFTHQKKRSFVAGKWGLACSCPRESLEE